LNYTISFMQAKIEVLDEAAQCKDAGETVESSSSTSTVLHVYLGSGKKETTVAEFANSSARNGFRKMLEVFLNKFYQAHGLPHGRYLEIKHDQKVMTKILLIETAY
jgi:hypothetical protein